VSAVPVGTEGGDRVDRSSPPSAGPLRPFHFPAVERRTLSNGARAVFAPVRGFPVVTLSVLLDAGAFRDPSRQLGLAALSAELLESGTAARDAAEIAREVESLGVQLDTGAGWDTAHAGITSLSSRLHPATDILADLVLRPGFPAGEVERLRAERLAEILQRRADPRALASEAAARFLHAPDSRASRPLGGTAGTVGGLTRQDIVAFHAEHFVGSSANFVMVGDFEPEEGLALLESAFGDWAGGPAGPARSEASPRTDRRQLIVVNRPGAVQSEIRIGHLGPSRATEHYFPIVVMNAILGGMFSSRLNLNLRERHGYTYGVSSGFLMRRQSGAFQVATAVETDVTAAAVAEVLNEVRGIRDAPVTDAELQDAKNYFAGVFPLRLQTTDGIAGRLLELLVYDLPDDYFDTYRDNVLAVTAEDVRTAAQRFLDPEGLAIVIVGDAESLRPSLEDLDLGEIRVVAPDSIQDDD
jgi:zinc protease